MSGGDEDRWPKEDRRREDRERDAMLIRIDENVKNMKEMFLSHIEDEKNRFETHQQDNAISFSKIGKRTGALEKFVWLTMGALGIIEVAIKFFH